MSKTIIVSNRLPVRIEREDDEIKYKSSEGGLATGLGSIYKEGNNIWVGWPGATFDSEEDKAEVTEGLKGENMRPVFLSEEEVEQFYLGFSNQTLWPAFHYFMQYIDFKQCNWQSYVEVNQKFAEAIGKELEEGDIVWIHDYQLLLVPGMIRKMNPNTTIGFFQHIPFPSYEVFRTLPWRRELLEGMLGADYLAFHTYDDMRHFLSSVHRIAGYPHRGSTIQLDHRIVVADSLPMGIDYDKYAENARQPEAVEREQLYRESLGTHRLILSMDRLDYSKGILKRLRAFDRFLAEHPDYLEKVSLLLIVVPSRDKVPNYQHLKEQVDELVGKINSRYGRISWTPIQYFYRSYPFSVLGTFYRMCDVAMVTPLRDGMNLVCKEYVASRQNKDGVLILSEMAGASKELSDAILVNPNNQEQMVEAIKTALEMPLAEQRRRMEIMQATIRKYNIYNWVKLFFENLQRIKDSQNQMATLKLVGENKAGLFKAYGKASKRLILLDYDGTLINFNTDPEACDPSESLRDLLSKLCADPLNRVVIVSGRTTEVLDKWLGDLDLDIVAEHGIWELQSDGEWNKNPVSADNGWMEKVREVMNFYVDRTPGSFIEEKSNTIAWHYRKVEKGLGEIRKSEATSHLKHFTNEKGVQVVDGDHVVEVKPKATNKGRAAMRCYDRIQPDFVLCLGDDTTDEDMFEWLPAEAFTVKVGSGNSRARYSVKTVSAVHNLLSELSELGQLKSLGQEAGAV